MYLQPWHWFRTHFVLARSAAKAAASDSNRTTGVFGRRRRSGACCDVVTTGPETTVTMLLSGALMAGLRLRRVSRHDRRLREWTRSMDRSPVSPTVVDYLKTISSMSPFVFNIHADKSSSSVLSR